MSIWPRGWSRVETDGAEGRTFVIEATCVTGWLKVRNARLALIFALVDYCCSVPNQRMQGLERIALSIYMSISNIPLFFFFHFLFLIHLSA